MRWSNRQFSSQGWGSASTWSASSIAFSSSAVVRVVFTITAVGGWLLSAASIWAVSSSPSDRINSFTSHSGWEYKVDR